MLRFSFPKDLQVRSRRKYDDDEYDDDDFDDMMMMDEDCDDDCPSALCQVDD